MITIVGKNPALIKIKSSLVGLLGRNNNTENRYELKLTKEKKAICPTAPPSATNPARITINTCVTSENLMAACKSGQALYVLMVMLVSMVLQKINSSTTEWKPELLQERYSLLDRALCLLYLGLFFY